MSGRGCAQGIEGLRGGSLTPLGDGVREGALPQTRGTPWRRDGGRGSWCDGGATTSTSGFSLSKRGREFTI